MEMISTEKRSRAVAVPLILFVLTLLSALGLLIAALTIWLSWLFDSTVLSCIVVGSMFLLIAVAIYLAALRGAIKRMQERLETVYQTSRAIQSGFDWINDKILKFWQ